MASYLSVLIQAAEPANYKLNYDEHYMISVPLATTTTPGIASFDSDYFSVENGAVTLSEEYTGNLNNKVDKIVPEDTGIFAYVVRKVMGQVTNYAIEISQDADADTIARRYTDGRLKVGDGVDNADAVNKGQLTAATTDIPKSALAASVKTSLGKADTAVQAPVPKTDLATDVRASLGKADTAVQAPIPETDLSTDIRTKLNKAISRVGITPEAWQVLPVADRDINTMYFVGPYGTSPNQYFVEWMYFVNNGVGTWEVIGSTQSVDLSDYFTKSEINTLLAGKANVDGVYSGMSVGHANTADEANSLATTLGVTDETPTAMQPVGGSSDVTTTYQKLNKLVGCKVVKNQLADYADYNTGTSSGISGSIVGHKLVLSGTNTTGDIIYRRIMSAKYNLFVQGHKYFINPNQTSLQWYGNISGFYLNFTGAGVFTLNAAPAPFDFLMVIPNGTDVTGITFDMQVVDLTLRYGNNDVVNAIIGNDSSKYVEKLLAFDPNILVDTAYDTGSFSSCKSATLRTVDYNQWDEEVELGTFDINGQPVPSDYIIRSKNYMPVLGGGKYCNYCSNANGSIYPRFYDENKNFISALSGVSPNSTFTVPSNARYMRFGIYYLYGTTYNHDICIFLYWDGSRIGYEPYSAHDYTLPNKDLNGILTVKNGKVVADGDEEYPSGEGNTTRYAEVDLGTLNWGYLSTGSQFSPLFYVNLPLAKPLQHWSDTPNAICSKYSVVKRWADIFVDKTLAFDRTGSQVQVQVKDSAYSDAATFKAAMSGVKLIYELATPTALTAPTFPSTFYGDDFGTMWFLDEDGNVIDGLQGNEIFYKANVAGFAESLYSEAEGDPDYFEAAGDVPTDIANYLKGLTGYDATKTQTLKNVTGTLTWVDDV